ncbi:hypothetical protein K7711_06175 [Nocardia sp. CA2R105]|uniref:hypothetical protein n=1 Tax=Nocardia coffeae TaxID=2873381 RepID=UPI001CA70009|nr:hypothetical protein [Nocardia coffeae]MBY8856058.1 hypothetical protein [Nocardia coffeae]
MSPEATTWLIAVALACFLVVTVGGLRWQGVLHSRADSAHRFTPARLTTGVCAAPLRRFTVDQAHRAMQLHIDCIITECPRKQHAYNVLVEEGHVRPDAGRTR